MPDLKAWGWEWVRRSHLDQLEFKTGLAGERPVLELMASIANSPDERLRTAEFDDWVKRLKGCRLVLRSLGGDVQSFFPVTEVNDPGLKGRWKFRGASRIFGATGASHTAVGLFSFPGGRTIGAFLPYYPLFWERLEIFTDYPVAMELLPRRVQNLGPAREGAVRELLPHETDRREWAVRLQGICLGSGYTYTVIDCGRPIFIERKNYQNLAAGQAVQAEGSLYAYPDA